ncbi:galactose-specific lectin nattectin-like [Chelmon rostratus]|uniref:galactose-specific lectin nattectin-like n=1 Tax=Chelmon rostratus TaxID=109905 RepID=UPI001BEB7234|nr:galactose-specific lectin nattectin-like [Chelmon rostratus]
MASGLLFCVILCLTSGLWTGANAQGPEEGGCPSPWRQFRDRCYVVRLSELAWDDAQAACAAAGGELAKIDTEAERDFVKEMVKKGAGSNREAWIGRVSSAKVLESPSPSGRYEELLNCVDGAWRWFDCGWNDQREQERGTSGLPPPTNLGANFRECTWRGIFFVDSQTFWPWEY